MSRGVGKSRCSAQKEKDKQCDHHSSFINSEECHNPGHLGITSKVLKLLAFSIYMFWSSTCYTQKHLSTEVLINLLFSPCMYKEPSSVLQCLCTPMTEWMPGHPACFCTTWATWVGPFEALCTVVTVTSASGFTPDSWGACAPQLTLSLVNPWGWE